MATRIDDLPGPLPEDIKSNVNMLQDEMLDATDRRIAQVESNQSNIVADVRKKVKFAEDVQQEGLLASIKAELNEENMLLFVALIAAALPSLSVYVKDIPVLGAYASSDLTSALIKAAFLLFIYVILKMYVLPKLKL